jgi:polyhydroxybutyrate depolymerase
MSNERVLLLAVFAAGLTLVASCSSDLPPGGPIDLLGPPRCANLPDPSLTDPAAGCGAGQPTGVLELAPFGGGTTRGILVVPPDAGSTPLPLIWVFHGAYGTAQGIRDQLQLEPVVDGGAIIAYFQAKLGTWDVGATSADHRDLLTITQQLGQQYCIDRDRIFAAGFSAGAVFTLDVDCQNPNTFRAITAIAGTEDRFDTRCCLGKQSALLIHGDADQTIDIAGSTLAIERIGGADGCSKTPVPLDQNCVEYPGCSSGKALGFCEHSGDHIVPPWAAQEAWTFFQRFQ